MAQCSKLSLNISIPEQRDDLVCPADQIIDAEKLVVQLVSATENYTDEADLRRQTAAILLEHRKAGMTAIEAAFRSNPLAALPTRRAYCWLADCLVTCTFAVASQILHPKISSTDDEALALLAVGGYGRGEMAPQSDIDLLFLMQKHISPRAKSVIEAMLYILWDLHLKVGHSSRTLSDCLKLGAEDFTIRTALLEQRFLVGDKAPAATLAKRLKSELFQGTETEFVAAKLTERDERHERQGERYVVEPNVKEGKGGLRDLQSLYWIAKYVHHVESIEELVQLAVFRPEEYDRFQKAENFLLAVLGHLHLVTGRPNEQLTFDLQVEVADRMGYQDKSGRRAVEHFMQDYFRNATRVGDLTRIFLTKLEAMHTKPEPLLQRIFSRKPRVKDGYQVIHGRLAVLDEATFLSNPLNLLRVFEEGLRTGMLIHPDAMRLVTANLHLIDDSLRENREAQQIFLDLLLKHGNPERALRRMNELGVLAAFLPEFEPIVAMMQFNMYHSYTVDEHTIQVISNFSRIERLELEEELPISTEILRDGVDRKVLMVAMLLHDIGKGRDQDHSVLGAQIARKVAPRLGLSRNDCDTVEWLVRYHLLMSDMAQKRDIADPRTVRDFAKAVQTVKRLDLLTVLTVCDIRGVGPDTWNNWKAALIRALYRQTRHALEEGMEALNRENRGTEAKKTLRAELHGWDKKDIKHETARHYPPYWQGLHVTAHVVFANLLKGLGNDEIRIDLHPDDDRDATRVCFVVADHPGIFSRMCGALALVGANIVDARTFTSKDGYATAAFWVQDAEGSPF